MAILSPPPVLYMNRQNLFRLRIIRGVIHKRGPPPGGPLAPSSWRPVAVKTAIDRGIARPGSGGTCLPIKLHGGPGIGLPARIRKPISGRKYGKGPGRKASP